MGTIHWNTRGIHSTFVLVLFLVAFLSPERASAQCLTPPGDLTSNGNTNIVDIQCSILATLASLAGSDTPGCLSPLGLTDADLNCDGEITVVDIILNIELAFDNFLTDDTNGNGWIDSCSCDLGTPPPPPSEICIGATDEGMESLCAAEQGIIDSSAGAGVADSVVVCDGDDWWLPEEVEWSKQGVIETGFGYACILDEGCSSNQGYAQTRSRGLTTTGKWTSMEVLPNSEGSCDEDYTAIDDYCWTKATLTQLYNHNEKACITTCKEFKEAEFADMVAAGEDLSPYNESGAYFYAKEFCWDEDSVNPWEEVLPDGNYIGLCTWDGWENQEIYLPLWGGITGGHTPSWLGDASVVDDPVPTMLEAFEEYCDAVTEWPCSDYLLYDSVTNPTPEDNEYFTPEDNEYFQTCITWKSLDPPVCEVKVETGIPISATTLNAMMGEWKRDEAYAFWDPIWYQETGKFLQRLSQVLEEYDTHDLVKHIHLMGEGGRWTNYPPMGFRTLEELKLDVDSLWAMAEGSGIPTEKFVFNISQGTRAHRDTIDKAEEMGAGIATHSAGRLIVSQMAFQYPHLVYNEDLLAYRVIGDLPFSLLHSDLELFKTTNTFGEYRLLREFVLGSIAVGANSLMMTNWGIPSRGTFNIHNDDCVIDGMELSLDEDGNPLFLDEDGNPEVMGFGTISDGTYQLNSEFYLDELGCKDSPGNCERECMFDWDAIKEEGPADFMEWMNHAVGRIASGDPQAYVALYTRGAENPHEESIEEQLAEKKAGCAEHYPNLPAPYDDNWCQLEECTLTLNIPAPITETQLCYNSWWDAQDDKHLRSALLVQHAHHMHFNRNLSGGAGTADRHMDGSLYGEMLIGGNGNNMKNWTNGLDYPYEARSTWVPFSTGGDALYFDLEDAFVNSGIDLETADGVLGSNGLPSSELPTSAYAVKVTFAPSILPPPSLEDQTPDGSGGVVIPEEGEYYDPDSDSGQFRLEYHGEDGWTVGPTVCFDATDTGFKTATFHLTDAVFGQGGEITFLPADWLVGADPTGWSDLAVRHVDGAHASYQLIRVIKLP